jgi:surface protein
MFGYAEQFNSDISYWNTENVEFFSDMFHGTKNFNKDLSKWNVSKGVLFNGMFYNSSFNKDINSWDVSNAVNMSGMFDNNLYFNKPLSNWNVSKVRLMGGMFAEARHFNQDISMWDVTNVTIMDNMFRNASNFKQDLSLWRPNIINTPKDFQLKSSFIGPTFKTPVSKTWFWLIPVFSLIPVYFYGVNRLKKSPTSEEYHDIIKKLKIKGKEGGYYLTKSELDKILNIYDLDYEKQKAKRSIMIRAINTYKPNLINRVKDPNDKRSFLYEIMF